tara:strand:+ start:202 stop:1122 length:921 start_codon:yes stop_codon:yes gene_type:complete
MSAFLRPNAQEQTQLRSKVEERQRAKKAKSKIEAADRKRIRDADKERIAAIEEELAANKTKREAQTPFQKVAIAAHNLSAEDIQRDQVCNDYLDGDEMLGRSAYNDKDLIKGLCGEGTRVFNKDSKLWGTTNHEALGHLIRSHRWHPFGIPEEWQERLLALAAERTEALHRKTEATNMVKREAAIPQVSHEDAARIAAERERGQRAALLREWFTASTPEERAEIEALKLDNAGLLDKTQGLAELGPVVGSSTEGRVLRWIGIEIYGEKCKYERDARYWDKAFMATVEAKGRERAVKRLKSLVNAAN